MITVGQILIIREAARREAIKEVMQLARDWDTLHGNDFDAKYGVHQDGFGFQKSLPEVIELYFGIGVNWLR